jgi:hypothetical protein
MKRRNGGEGDNPNDTVHLYSDTYRSTGVLDTVLQYSTRKGRDFTALLIEQAWFYADADADEWAAGLIDQHVTVTWRLAYGRRYIKSLRSVAAEGADTEPETNRRRERHVEDGFLGIPQTRYPWEQGPF